MGKHTDPTGFTVAHCHSPHGATLHLSSILEIRDTLDNCRCHLHLLAEMFVASAEHVQIFSCDSSRLGMFHQLHGLAGTLAAIDHALTQATMQEGRE
ncbi:MAG TPA: hypothetical protein DCS21_06930 [Gammaproteobacteria bacterium]|nr:hypothetical protein [Gammaproteobacteria bacterium]